MKSSPKNLLKSFSICNFRRAGEIGDGEDGRRHFLEKEKKGHVDVVGLILLWLTRQKLLQTRPSRVESGAKLRVCGGGKVCTCLSLSLSSLSIF